MAVDTSLIGSPMAPSTTVIERTPVMNFAKAVKDESPVLQRPDAAAAAGFRGIPIPPTMGFAFTHNGQFPELQPPDAGGNPILQAIGALMKDGGLILHGEQEFIYHAPVVVGDTLHGTGTIKDIYEKTGSSGSVMTFVVAENEYRNQDGDLVLTSIMTLVHKA